jgi:DNA-binding response OmpR family regulator
MECKILIVDDDVALRQSLAEQLTLHGEFAISQAGTADAALDFVKQHCCHAIFLDVRLPDMDGRELCRLLRRNKVQAPILMLTGADTDADTILGYESGANDYIIKPFRLNVLLARLRAHLRQHEQSQDAVLAIGPYTFRPGAKLLVDATGRQKVQLTARETDLLKYLYRAHERVVSRDVLLSEVWGYNTDAQTHTPETHIYRLRQKIEADPDHPAILVTEPSGYRLVVSPGAHYPGGLPDGRAATRRQYRWNNYEQHA